MWISDWSDISESKSRLLVPTFSFVDAPPWIFRYSIIIKTLDCVTMVKVLSGPGIEVSMFYVYHR